MTDNARIDWRKLIERLRNAAWAIRYRKDPPGVAEMLDEAADALARRSIQEQPETEAASDVAKPMAASFFAAMLDTDDRTSPEEHPDMILVTEHEVLIAMTTAIIADRARLASAPPPIAGAGWKPPSDPDIAAAIGVLASASFDLGLTDKPRMKLIDAAVDVLWQAVLRLDGLAASAQRTSPVPDNTDARGAQVGWSDALMKLGHDVLDLALPSSMGVSSEQRLQFNSGVVAAATLIKARAAIIPGTDASGVIEP